MTTAAEIQHLQQHGLYSSGNEHDACGLGFVAHIKGVKRHDIVTQALKILENIDHRGAVGADPLMGDGAGILIQIPDALYREEMAKQGVTLPAAGEYGVGMIFLPKEHASRLACEQELERAKVQFENSSRQVDILQKSLSDLVEKLRLNLINAETQLNIQKENTSDYYLSSFIDGRVLEVYKNQGDLVRRGETIARIGGGKPLIKLFVGEEDIAKIKVGQLTTVSLNTQKDDLLEARISKIYPAFDELQQSFICEATFAEAPELYVNTQLQANIIIAQKENALVIPSNYLLPGDSILYKDGEKAAVKAGIRTSDWVEIISKLDTSRLIKQMEKI